MHNGALSNHNDVRRSLIREGIQFATQNDTEVAAGYLSYKLREGAKLDEALTGAGGQVRRRHAAGAENLRPRGEDEQLRAGCCLWP